MGNAVTPVAPDAGLGFDGTDGGGVGVPPEETVAVVVADAVAPALSVIVNVIVNVPADR